MESTDCAPNNGYYFLPLSPDDRGLFVLKPIPPRGWKIEPQEFEVQIDGETDACSTRKDINFQFIALMMFSFFKLPRLCYNQSSNQNSYYHQYAYL